MRLHIGTSNAGKLQEFRDTLTPAGIEVVGTPATFAAMQVAETGDTFAANARLKLAALCAPANDAALADDSGLQVDALDGAPGVFSARWAAPVPGLSQDAANRQKLLQTLQDVPPRQRGARFVAALALRLPGEPVQIFEGSCRGQISQHEEGEHGFGYDAIFIPEGATQTFAQLPASYKRAHSHRAAALNLLLAYWRERCPR